MGTEELRLSGPWRLELAPGSAEPITGYAITLELREGAVGGHSGVNRYRGQATVTAAGDTAGRLTFGPLAMTLMAGPPEAMAAEHVYLGLLAQVTDYRLGDGRLVLLAGGQPLLEFVAGEVRLA